MRREALAAVARHSVYGSVVVLAVIVALEDDATPSWAEAFAAVVGAAIAAGLAETYADYIGDTIRKHGHPGRGFWRENAHATLLGFLAASLPAVPFALSGIGLMGIHLAFTIAIWVGVGILGTYAFIANRASGFSVARSLLIGLAFTLLGAILVFLKLVLG